MGVMITQAFWLVTGVARAWA